MRTYNYEVTQVTQGRFFQFHINKYTVNGKTCAEDQCEPRVLQSLNDGEDITIGKKSKVHTGDNTSLSILKFGFSLTLNHDAVNIIKNTGEHNYKKLITYALSTLDSAVLSEENFEKHMGTLQQKLFDLYSFYFGFTIDKNALFLDEIQHVYTEYNCLIFTNLVFTCSKITAGENATYMEKFGNDCLPKIIFPSAPGYELNDQDAKQFVEDILSNHSTLKRNFEESPCFSPSIKNHALETLDKIKAMAQKYTEIFNEAPTENIGRTLS